MLHQYSDHASNCCPLVLFPHAPIKRHSHNCAGGKWVGYRACWHVLIKALTCHLRYRLDGGVATGEEIILLVLLEKMSLRTLNDKSVIPGGGKKDCTSSFAAGPPNTKCLSKPLLQCREDISVMSQVIDFPFPNEASCASLPIGVTVVHLLTLPPVQSTTPP